MAIGEAVRDCHFGLNHAGSDRKEKAVTQDDIHEEDERLIAERAYALYQSRGGEHGRDVEDWLAAKEQVRGARRKEAPTGESQKPNEPLEMEVQEEKGLR